MATTTPTKLTADEFYEWASRPENGGKEWELDEGEVVEMPPPTRGHGLHCWLFIKVLTEYLSRRKAGHILTNDAGIVVGRRPDTLRGADVMLFLRDPEPQDFETKYVNDIPDLIVEVVSASDRDKQINRRVAQYLHRGVPLVWLIDPRLGTVSVCRPNEFPRVLDETDELTGNGVLPDFACRVRDLFTSPGASPPAS